MESERGHTGSEQVKDRAAVLAEREAKKLAKKNKTKPLGAAVKCDSTPSARKVAPPKEERPATDNSGAPRLDGGSVVKTNAELKAERRAKQEAQRSAKVKATPAPLPAVPKLPEVATSRVVANRPTPTLLQHKVQVLFNHLYVDRESAHAVNAEGVHPAVYRVGMQYRMGTVLGSNARCLAMLTAIKQLIAEFRTPVHEEYGRSLDSALQKATDYLHSCRPISVSMTNALRFLKYQLTLLPNNIDDLQASHTLNTNINTYIREQIDVADQAIKNTVQPKIVNGDVILIYGCSSLIESILLDAHHSNKQFRVVVVDSRPGLEGREMLRRLVANGMKCTYVLITTTSFIMPSVSKVLLGAHAFLANGYVMSRAGTAQVALMARAHNVPVLVCCETYKFCERVQTDAFVYNEIAESNGLSRGKIGNRRMERCTSFSACPSVIPLNLTYDVTPPDLVTAVVTELAILPCTSVPVILRIKPTDNSFQ